MKPETAIDVLVKTLALVVLVLCAACDCYKHCDRQEECGLWGDKDTCRAHCEGDDSKKMDCELNCDPDLSCKAFEKCLCDCDDSAVWDTEYDYCRGL